jgi:hypothetical protein
MTRTTALTTIGNAHVQIDVEPAALPEAAGGVTIWIRSWGGTVLAKQTAYTLTAGEARELVAAIADVIEEAPA